MIFFVQNTYAQGKVSGEDLEYLRAMDDTLSQIADSMYEAYLPEDRPEFNERFVKKLVEALKVPNSFSFPFDSLRTRINILESPDSKFRIFNWEVVPQPSQRRYYGAIQKASEDLDLYPLVDYTNALGKGAEDSVLTNNKWYGAIYYKVIPREVNGTTVYTLFGKNESSLISTKKVLDPMVLTEDGVVFGMPVFNVVSEQTGERVKRFILEYKKDVAVSLNWNDEMNAISFDKLVSQMNDPNRKYTYVPSGQYDGFKWKDNQWTYVKDLIPLLILEDGEAPVPQPK